MANKKKITREPEQASCSPDVYKAHQAIAVLPATGSRITLLTRRFFNVLLQHAQQQGGGETYRLPFDQILQGAGYGSANFEVAKNTLRSMAKTTVEWSVVREDGADEGERRWGVSALLADAELIEVGRRLFLEWSYSPKIRQHLLDPTRYMQLSLQIYSTLRSGTAAALYEVCLRYVTNARGLTNKAEWEWWRPRLTGIPDADDAHSSEYKYFKRDTLMVGLAQPPIKLVAIDARHWHADLFGELHNLAKGAGFLCAGGNHQALECTPPSAQRLAHRIAPVKDLCHASTLNC